MTQNLIGIGLYTPAEAGRLIRVPPGKISRWLRGHTVRGANYAPLWESNVALGDSGVYLDFLDLMEVRVVDAFIRYGVPPVQIRSAISLAKELLARSHPLSTNRFLTDGREIFLQVVERDKDGVDRKNLLNLFRRQYEFEGVLDPILKAVDFEDDGSPGRWWPTGRQGNIVVDPKRAFGAPIDAQSGVPTKILAAAGDGMGIGKAAKAYLVPEESVRRAMDFEASMEHRSAA